MMHCVRVITRIVRYRPPWKRTEADELFACTYHGCSVHLIVTNDMDAPRDPSALSSILMIATRGVRGLNDDVPRINDSTRDEMREKVFEVDSIDH